MSSIRRVSNAPAATFDEQGWPVNGLLLILAGCAAGVIAADGDFETRLLIYNAGARIAALFAVVVGLMIVAAQARGRVQRRLQLAILVSLCVHLAVSLGMRELRLAVVPPPSQKLAEQYRPVLLPDYSRPVLSQDDPRPQEHRPFYEQPVETEPTPVEREPLSKPAAQPIEVELQRPSETPPVEPRPTPLPRDEPRPETTPPRRAENLASPERSRHEATSDSFREQVVATPAAASATQDSLATAPEMQLARLTPVVPTIEPFRASATARSDLTPQASLPQREISRSEPAAVVPTPAMREPLPKSLSDVPTARPPELPATVTPDGALQPTVAPRERLAAQPRAEARNPSPEPLQATTTAKITPRLPVLNMPTSETSPSPTAASPLALNRATSTADALSSPVRESVAISAQPAHPSAAPSPAPQAARPANSSTTGLPGDRPLAAETAPAKAVAALSASAAASAAQRSAASRLDTVDAESGVSQPAVVPRSRTGADVPVAALKATDGPAPERSAAGQAGPFESPASIARDRRTANVPLGRIAAEVGSSTVDSSNVGNASAAVTTNSGRERMLAGGAASTTTRERGSASDGSPTTLRRATQAGEIGSAMTREALPAAGGTSGPASTASTTSVGPANIGPQLIVANGARRGTAGTGDVSLRDNQPSGEPAAGNGISRLGAWLAPSGGARAAAEGLRDVFGDRSSGGDSSRAGAAGNSSATGGASLGRSTPGVGSGIEVPRLAAVVPSPATGDGSSARGNPNGSAGIRELGPAALASAAGQRSSPGPAAGLLARIEAPLGAGGLGGPTPGDIGLPNRRARPDSELIHEATPRIILERAGGGPTVDARVRDVAVHGFKQRDRERRGDVARQLGGTASTEQAVELGLEFLARHQSADGSWSLHNFHAERGYDDPAAGSMQSSTAGTGLAMLAFLGAGYTHTDGKYREHVQRGLTFLTTRQAKNGDLFIPQDAQSNTNVWLYSHGIAAIAMCEAFGMTRDEALRDPAQRALEFIVSAQAPEGGWRYRPRDGSDTSVSGWQLMALKSGELAGLRVPPKTYTQVTAWLDAAQGAGGSPARYAYMPRSRLTHQREPSRVMTAEALLMRQYLGWRRDHQYMVAGADWLRTQLPEMTTAAGSVIGGRDAYYWYYATQVMFQMQGAYWNDWNSRLRSLLVDSQEQSGPLAGSWHPLRPRADRWGREGGRLYVTALHLLMLEVYYRHLPIYQTLSVDEPQ